MYKFISTLWTPIKLEHFSCKLFGSFCLVLYYFTLCQCPQSDDLKSCGGLHKLKGCSEHSYFCAMQVFPGAWTAILISLDNVGVWNLRAENLDSWHLGQETYVRVVNPEATNKTELPMPDNALFCGALSKMQKYA